MQENNFIFFLITHSTPAPSMLDLNKICGAENYVGIEIDAFPAPHLNGLLVRKKKICLLLGRYISFEKETIKSFH